MDEIFESAVRQKGDFAGVFEFDGEAAYFYLYEIGADSGNKIVDAIRIASCAPQLAQADIEIRWDVGERRVGLFIKTLLWAAFDCISGHKFGGHYLPNASPDMPDDVRSGFSQA